MPFPPRPGSERGHRRRVVLDGEGTRWTVSERPAGQVPGARAERSLVFDSERRCFRVWDYPASWSNLADGELLVLGRLPAAVRG
jgi:hypothetical protein